VGGGCRKKSKSIYRTSQNIRIINVFLKSLLSESFLLLGVTVYLTSLGCPPTLCWLISEPAVGTTQIVIWSYSCVFLPPMSPAIRTSVFSFVGALSDLLISNFLNLLLFFLHLFLCLLFLLFFSPCS